MSAAKLNRRIVIQAKGEPQVDSEGIVKQEWVDHAVVWASRKPLTSRWREHFQAAALKSEKMVQYEIRYRKGITADMRLIDSGTIYDIKAVLDDVHGDRTESWLMALDVSSG